MRERLNSNLVFLFVLAIVVVGVVFGSNMILSRVRNADQISLPATPASTGNVIQQENALQGTAGWKIPADEIATTQIQAYTSATSVQPGQKLTFYVSTQVDGTPYSIGIYRLGWYTGLGGRLKLLLAHQTGHAQGYYDDVLHRLVDCSSCYVNKQLGLIEANWQPSYTLTVPADWVTGVYLAKFADANGMQTYVSFTVRGNDHSAYLFVVSDTTYEAYNLWGGYSLYGIDSASASVASGSEDNSTIKAVKVSFDRPYMKGYGPWQVLGFDLDAIHWMEHQGYDLSYISNVDLHEHPQQLLQHRVYLSVGHDEYWTKEMYDGVEYARDHGVSLGFFGANEIYWQMRFEPDSAGVSDRVIVCYKVGTTDGDLANDPFYRKDNSRVTSRWRDPVVNRPENALVGIMYSAFTHKQLGFPWKVSSQANSPLLSGTGLLPGQQYGCSLVGYEWDRVSNNGLTPRGIQVIGASGTVSDVGVPDASNTVYYIAPSGAMVFAAGSIYWTAALDNYRLLMDPHCNVQQRVVPGMQKLMANVMDALLTHHISSTAGSALISSLAD